MIVIYYSQYRDRYVYTHLSMERDITIISVCRDENFSSEEIHMYTCLNINKLSLWP